MSRVSNAALAKDSDSLNKVLESAISNQDLVSCQRLLKKGANPSYVTTDGTSMLALSISTRNAKIVDLLLKKEARCGETESHPAHLAAFMGSVELLQVLHNNKVDIFAKNKGMTALDFVMTEVGLAKNQPTINLKGSAGEAFIAVIDFLRTLAKERNIVENPSAGSALALCVSPTVRRSLPESVRLIVSPDSRDRSSNAAIASLLASKENGNQGSAILPPPPNVTATNISAASAASSAKRAKQI